MKRAWLVLAAALAVCAADAADKPRPSWLGSEPIVIVGNWDSMPVFRRRVGGNPVWLDEQYAREHTEEAVAKLKDLGVTMGVIHFYKGYGLAAEREHMDDARKLAAMLKKAGLRVGLYVGSTIGYETFLAEKPEISDWFAPPFLGRPLYYSEQTFRKRVYFMHPGYRHYMKRVLRIGVEDFKADLIHFDNTSLQAQPPIFRHPMAVEDFRRYLQKKYTPEQLKRRFGFAEVRHMEPPETDRPPTIINDPLFQEWTDFRCEQLTAYYAEMEAYIRGLNPETAVENNPHVGISGRNTAWEEGVDYPRLLQHTDIVWTEEGNEAGISPEGILVSKIRSFKMASSLNNSVFTYTGGSARGGKLQMAEAMAYNRQNLGMVGGMLAGYEFPDDQKPYIKFFHKNFDRYFGAVESRADVAVLHSYASMAYNNGLPWQSAMLAEQALIQGHVPFDLIFDHQLKDLSRYRTLLLADQEALSDEQAEAIRRYVQAGGGLVATEHSSLFTPWRERRRNYALSDLFGVDAPQFRGGRAGESPPAGAEKRSQPGKGRVVYIPAIQPAIEKPAAAAMTSQYWKLPLNWRQLVDAVKWTSGGLALETSAPPTVTAELLGQKAGSRLILHLVNYGVEQTPSVPKIEVSLRLPEGRSAASVTVASPEVAEPLSLPHAVKAGRVTFAVPRVQTYSVAAVELK